ncbi:hypothetical protein P3W23_03185 [Luteibacter sp. PPL554]
MTGTPAMVRGPAAVAGAPRLDYVYRADTRSMDSLKNGFVPRYDLMSVDDLRELVRVFAGVKTLADSALGSHIRLRPTGPLNGPLMDALGKENSGASLNALDLHRHIIQANPRGPWVSADPDKACGGYAGGRSIYRIDMRYMRVVPWREAVPGAKGGRMWPHLLIDGRTVDDAKHFALHASIGATREVTFLGTIPAEWITLVA